MRFIAIDSSLSNTGIAVGEIKDGKVLVEKIMLHSTSKTKNKQIRASSDTITRCRSTHRFVHDIIAKEKPKVIFIETPQGSQNSSAMKSYGATCQLIASLEPDPIEVTPTEVKFAVTGKKEASKTTIINWAIRRYHSLTWEYHHGKPKNKMEHMADAIAIAHAGIATSDFIRLQKMLK